MHAFTGLSISRTEEISLEKNVMHRSKFAWCSVHRHTVLYPGHQPLKYVISVDKCQMSSKSPACPDFCHIIPDPNA